MRLSSSRCFSGELNGWRRFTDFLVYEVGLDGEVVRLKNINGPPKQPKAPKEKAPEAGEDGAAAAVEQPVSRAFRQAKKQADSDHQLWNETSEAAISLVLPSAKVEEFKAFVLEGPAPNGPKTDPPTPIRSFRSEVCYFAALQSPAPDKSPKVIEAKEARTAFHRGLRDAFAGRFSSEVKEVEGGAQVIEVTWNKPGQQKDRISKGRSVYVRSVAVSLTNACSRAPKSQQYEGPPPLHPLYAPEDEQGDARRALGTHSHPPSSRPRPRNCRNEGQARRHRPAREHEEGKPDDRGCLEGFKGRWRRARTRARQGRVQRRRERARGSDRGRRVQGLRARSRNAQGQQVCRHAQVSSLFPGFFDEADGTRSRDVEADSPQTIERAIDTIRTRGFINYYGMQRFGTAPIPTHVIGLAILRSDWALAAHLLLRPRDGEGDDVAIARIVFAEGKVSEAVRLMPRRAVAERASALIVPVLRVRELISPLFSVLEHYDRVNPADHLGALSKVTFSSVPLLEHI